MPRFHVKKTSLSDDGHAIVFKGVVVEGPIHRGMDVDVPVTDAATIKLKISEVVYFEQQKDPEKKIGIIVDCHDEPEALDIVLGLNIMDETMNVQ